ncbi:MAG: hypothetical protein ACLT4C_04125 [Butyricicoccus sp.]
MRFFALGVQWILQNAAESAMPNSVTATELQRSTASAVCQEHLLFLEGVFKVRVLDVVVASARNGQLGATGHDERFRRDRLDML